MTATLQSNDAALGYEDVSDEELLLTYRSSGQRILFETLMKRYQREIYSYLRRYLGDAEQAEDAFQLTFLQVHLRAETFEEGRKFRPWFYAIATNQAIDLQRKNRRHRMVSLDRTRNVDDDESKWTEKLVGNDPDPWLVASGRENQDSVQGIVAQLSDSMQKVVQLVYYQGLKYREAADVLGIPVGTVKSRLNAAVSRLNQLWEESQSMK
ncbi:ECF RNA polymerase sigma factor SigW [Rosistilla oblonga]|uniref:RNA polymerase sigma factor n=1 Tax=Rosistilla oblonga TaxID=2527990 RepID=UPI00118B2556|nr:RNA polymerase sigma factor [Rosistilla oblonga]QDV13424.1 ECF RNA polymerase sigma factor SigW [Rosistilla oblonga]